MTAVLEAKGVTAGYGPQPVIHDVDIRVEPGELVALLGPNGAGKTTTLLALAGELPLQSGSVELRGRRTTASLYRRARAGLGFVPEERSVFRSLTARENLKVSKVSVESALAIFPELEKRLDVRAGLLSGGEQQMLTLARAIGRKPAVLIADELSLGLAPLIVDRLLEAARAVAESGESGVLLVEQHARKALQHVDRAYVLRRGRVVLAADAVEARARLGEIEDSYLTGAGEDA